MENDQAFEAEADFDALRTLRSDSRKQSLHKGHDVMRVAYGGIESADQDDTPLLSRDHDRDHNAEDSAEDDGGDDRDKPKWSGEHDFDGLPWWRTPSIYWLLPAFLLFTMAYGGTLVPKIDLILSLVCQEYFSERSIKDPSFHTMPVIFGGENPQCRIPEVQSLVSKFTLYCNLISGILSAIVSPKLGALSDRYGRTRMIAISTIGMLLSELITVIVATYPDMFSVRWFLVGYAFDGLGGTFIAAMALSFAYASDCTIPEKRNVAFGYYHGCLFTGIALGPIFAGYIVKETGKIITIFYIAIAAHAVFFLWLVFVVPESLTKVRQLAARERKQFVGEGEGPTKDYLSTILSPLTQLFAPLSILWPTAPGTNPAVRRNLFFLAAVDTTMFGVAMGSVTILLIYSKFAFGWGNFETSVFLSTINTCRVTVLMVLLPIATRLLRGPSSRRNLRNSGCDGIDLGIIRTAIFFDMLGYIGYTTVRTGNLFIASGALASIGGVGSPTLSAALTKHVPPERTGQLLGAMGLLHAAARVVAPTIFNLIYAQTVGKFTQTVFLCLSATFGLAFVFSWFIRPHVYWDQPHTPPDAYEPESANGEEDVGS